jgi:tRNA acetyltransferase TAN1
MDQAAKGADPTTMFTPVRISLDCLLFCKTRAPIEPVLFVHRLCQDAKAAGAKGRRTRFINRLSPNQLIGKATESGLLELSRTVLVSTFDLTGKTSVSEQEEEAKQEAQEVNAQAEEEAEPETEITLEPRIDQPSYSVCKP